MENFLILDSVTSTNDYAKTLARQGAAHGTAVLAKSQSAGRGRMGRTFLSPEGGLYLSVILRPRAEAAQLMALTPVLAEAACDAVEQVTGIVEVRAYEEVASGFIAVRNVATVVCVALIAILFVVSVFIISNTIKLTTFDRREEIAIMRMVGATNGFIRWPFVYEGFMLGLLCALVAFFLQWGLYETVARSVESSDVMQLVHVIPFVELWHPVAITFACAGFLMGVGGSLSAIRRFLRV